MIPAHSDIIEIVVSGHDRLVGTADFTAGVEMIPIDAFGIPVIFLAALSLAIALIVFGVVSMARKEVQLTRDRALTGLSAYAICLLLIVVGVGALMLVWAEVIFAISGDYPFWHFVNF